MLKPAQRTAPGVNHGRIEYDAGPALPGHFVELDFARNNDWAHWIRCGTVMQNRGEVLHPLRQPLGRTQAARVDQDKEMPQVLRRVGSIDPGLHMGEIGRGHNNPANRSTSNASP